MVHGEVVGENRCNSPSGEDFHPDKAVLIKDSPAPTLGDDNEGQHHFMIWRLQWKNPASMGI